MNTWYLCFIYRGQGGGRYPRISPHQNSLLSWWLVGTCRGPKSTQSNFRVGEYNLLDPTGAEWYAQLSTVSNKKNLVWIPGYQICRVMSCMNCRTVQLWCNSDECSTLWIKPEQAWHMQADKLTYTNWTLYTYMTLHSAWSSMSCTQQDRRLYTGTAESAITEHDDRLKITLYKNVKSESSRSRGTDPAYHMLSKSGSCSCTDRWKHLPHRSMNRSMPTPL